MCCHLTNFPDKEAKNDTSIYNNMFGAIVLWLQTAIFTVDETEQAVVLQFGNLFELSAMPA
jgi:hypothetical protein